MKKSEVTKSLEYFVKSTQIAIVPGTLLVLDEDRPWWVARGRTTHMQARGKEESVLYIVGKARDFELYDSDVFFAIGRYAREQEGLE